MSYVYVLKNTQTGQVYTGYTNRPKHRLEAHRGERSGGARTTGKWKAGTATMIILVGPFLDVGGVSSKSAALSFERKMKKVSVGYGGVKGRVLALYKLLSSPQGKITGKVGLVYYTDNHRLHVQCALTLNAFLAHARTKTRKTPALPATENVLFSWNQPLPPL